MILDTLPEMQKLDRAGVYLSVTSLADQMKSAWQSLDNQTLPPEFKLAQNVVLAGMGGSALAGRIIKELLANKLMVPFEICTGYHLPHYVNSNTLVILSSYSGNTEETVAAAHEAKTKDALIFGVTTGGRLAKFLKDEESPAYIFDPKHNPSGQPRMSLGYSIVAIAALLQKCGLLTLSNDEITQAFEKTVHFIHQFSARVPKHDNAAKMIAEKLHGKVPVLIASEHLWGSVHAFKNQINENAKTFAACFDIPELNHHLMEGLRFPQNAKQMLYFMFFKSKHYSDRVQLRYPITADVIEKNHFSFSVYELTSLTKIEESFELLTLGSYASFYMAMLNGIDPSPIPWVDYFKENLGK